MNTQLPILAMIPLLVACSGPESLTIAVADEGVAGGTQVALLWVIDKGPGQYVKAGGGIAHGNEALLDLPTQLPEPAVLVGEEGQIAIGHIFLLDADADIPDGTIDPELSEDVVGVAENHALIWRSNNAPLEEAIWPNAFPSGYSCGQCRPDTFYNFDPVSCHEAVISVDPNPSFNCAVITD